MITSKLEKPLIHEHVLFIDGELVSPSSKETYTVLNPATEETLGVVPLANEEDILLAIQSSKEAFTEWKELTINERCNYLLKVADRIEEHRENLALVESSNVGKPLSVALLDVDALAENLRYYASAARGLHNISSGEYLKGYMSQIVREPLGVIAAIAPWNYPLTMAGWKIGPALVMGNTMVLKPSEHTPFSALYLGQILKDILPKGVLNIIVAKGQTAGDAFLAADAIPMISLTGSITAGQYLVENSATSLKKIHLELGGKAPAVVFKDANLETAIPQLVDASFCNSGQDCTAVTRIYVAQEIYDQFIEQFKTAMTTIRVGHPLDAKTTHGPLVSKEHFERVSEFVEEAKEAGATTYAVPMDSNRQTGYYYPPTIVMDAKQESRIIQEEVFGPVITISPFTTEEEAYRLANDSKYALSASIWTTDVATSLRGVKALEAGTVWVNAHLVFVSEMPHSGDKMSGHSKGQSTYSFDEYSKVKHIMYSTN